jgi:hypothetical protein
MPQDDRSTLKRICSIVIAGSLVCPLANAQSPFYRIFSDPDTTGWGTNMVIEASNTDIVQLSWQFEYGTDSTYLLFQRFSANGGLLASTRTIPPTGAVLYITCATELPGGDFLLFGMDQRPVIVRLDALGALVSVNRRNGDLGRYETVIWENDSTLLALGIDEITGGRQLLMSRFDPTGGHLGSQGIRIDGRGATGISATRSTAGGVLICAAGHDTLLGGWSTQATACSVKLDSAGGVEWAKRYIFPGKLISPVGMAELSDGSILIGGIVSWFPAPPRYLLLMRTAADGDTLWQRQLNLDLAPDTFLYPRAFVAISDTSFLFTGWMGDYRGFALRVDEQGLIGPAARMTASLTLDRTIRTSAGDIVIPASDLPTGNFSGGVGLGLWRTDDPFALLCSEPLDIGYTDFDVDVGQGFVTQAVTMTFDDITAQCTQTTPTMMAYDPCVPGGQTTIDPDGAADMEIWPNPASEVLFIRGDGIQGVELLDATGRVLLSRSMRNNERVEIDTAPFACGVYHLRVKCANGWRGRTIVKE